MSRECAERRKVIRWVSRYWRTCKRLWRRTRHAWLMMPFIRSSLKPVCHSKFVVLPYFATNLWKDYNLVASMISPMNMNLDQLTFLKLRKRRLKEIELLKSSLTCSKITSRERLTQRHALEIDLTQPRRLSEAVATTRVLMAVVDSNQSRAREELLLLQDQKQALWGKLQNCWMQSMISLKTASSRYQASRKSEILTMDTPWLRIPTHSSKEKCFWSSSTRMTSPNHQRKMPKKMKILMIKRAIKSQKLSAETILYARDFSQWQRPKQAVRVLWQRSRNSSLTRPKPRFSPWKWTWRAHCPLWTGTTSRWQSKKSMPWSGSKFCPPTKSRATPSSSIASTCSQTKTFLSQFCQSSAWSRINLLSTPRPKNRPGT